MESSGMDWAEETREGRTPWDLRSVTPALEALAARGGLRDLEPPPRARLAVPGCGRGHDLRFLAAQGFDVTGFDVAPGVVDEARQLVALNGVDAVVLRRDVLGLMGEFEAAFDLVYECTCLCVLPRHLRRAYAETIAGLLAPGGVLLALVFPMTAEHAGCGGPPHLVTESEARTVFRPLVLERSFPTDVFQHPRAGAERWYVWRKPPAS